MDATLPKEFRRMLIGELNNLNLPEKASLVFVPFINLFDPSFLFPIRKLSPFLYPIGYILYLVTLHHHHMRRIFSLILFVYSTKKKDGEICCPSCSCVAKTAFLQSLLFFSPHILLTEWVKGERERDVCIESRVNSTKGLFSLSLLLEWIYMGKRDRCEKTSPNPLRTHFSFSLSWSELNTFSQKEKEEGPTLLFFLPYPFPMCLHTAAH